MKMAQQIKEPQGPVASFDYELYEGDPENLRTVVSTPAQPSPYINPASLQLKHRIGRGFFGDVWLATHHRSASDYDEYHEVAVKRLYPVKENHIKEFLSKFEELWTNLKSRASQGVCWLHGISVISGRICIAMKFYEGSVGDRMARLKGGKLPLPDVLRCGIEIAKGIQELHLIGLLVLNLKPSNFLLNEQNQVVLGDFGIPFLLRGISLTDPELAFRLGTPNYMAPEQWQPETRGPIAYETDSWGFGCCMIEMLTGIQPWFGRSIEEIHHLVVIKQEQPKIPSGLPPAVEDVLMGCFEYDFRNRPLMSDILQAFESSQNAVYNDGEWSGQGSNLFVNNSSCSGYTTWFLSKDHLQIGDIVRSRKASNTCKPQSLAVSEGTVVGLEKDTDRDGFVLVRIPNIHNPQRINVATLERVTSGFVVGDWVRLIRETNNHSSLGILHSTERNGRVTVGFLGLDVLWKGHSSELEIAESFFAGQFVRLKANVVNPHFEWPYRRGQTWGSGKISQILPNGCLIVTFPGMFVFGDRPNSFLADPNEVERVSLDMCPGIVEKYEYIEDLHWAVRPVTITLGLITAVKLSLFAGKTIRAILNKGNKSKTQDNTRNQDGQRGGNSAWLPPKVANILFKEAATGTASSR